MQTLGAFVVGDVKIRSAGKGGGLVLAGRHRPVESRVLEKYLALLKIMGKIKIGDFAFVLVAFALESVDELRREDVEDVVKAGLALVGMWRKIQSSAAQRLELPRRAARSDFVVVIPDMLDGRDQSFAPAVRMHKNIFRKHRIFCEQGIKFLPGFPARAGKPEFKRQIQPASGRHPQPELLPVVKLDAQKKFGKKNRIFPAPPDEFQKI